MKTDSVLLYEAMNILVQTLGNYYQIMKAT